MYIHINSINSPSNIPTPNNTPTTPNAHQMELILNLAYGPDYINSYLKNSDDLEDSVKSLWDYIKNGEVLLISSVTGEIFHITTVNDIINNWGFYAPFVLS